MSSEVLRKYFVSQNVWNLYWNSPKYVEKELLSVTASLLSSDVGVLWCLMYYYLLLKANNTSKQRHLFAFQGLQEQVGVILFLLPLFGISWHIIWAEFIATDYTIFCGEQELWRLLRISAHEIL